MLNLKKVFAVLWILSLGFYCVNKPVNRKANTDDIVCLRVTSLYPYFDWKDPNRPKLVRYDSLKTNIFLYHDQVIYQEFYHWNEEDSIGQSLRHEFRSNYFVYTKGHQQGLLFDKYRNIQGKKVSVDSMLSKLWAVKPTFIDVLNLAIVSSNKNRKTGELSEDYSFRGKKDTSLTGHLLMDFSDESKFRRFDYSFSDSLDSSKKMKLYKATLIYDARYVEYAKTYMEKIEIPFLIEVLPVTDKKQIEELFRTDTKSFQ